MWGSTRTRCTVGKQTRVDADEVPGTTTGEAARIKHLEQEVRELKRANEILMAASSFMRHRSSTRDCRGDRVHR